MQNKEILFDLKNKKRNVSIGKLLEKVRIDNFTTDIVKLKESLRVINEKVSFCNERVEDFLKALSCDKINTILFDINLPLKQVKSKLCSKQN